MLSMFEVKIPTTLLHRVNSHFTLKLREVKLLSQGHTAEPVEWDLSLISGRHLAGEALARQCAETVMGTLGKWPHGSGQEPLSQAPAPICGSR